MECWEKQFVRLLFPYSAKRLNVGHAYMLKERHIPQKLYKYRNFNKYHMQALRDGVLWLSAPEHFNDPYDSAIYFDSRGFLTENLSVEEAIARTEAQVTPSDIAQAWEQRDLANPIRKDELFAKIHEELLRDFPESVRSALETAIEDIQRQTNLDLTSRMTALSRNGMSVLSLSENPVSALMWAHYSDSHRGFCVEYDFGSLGADDFRRRFCYPVLYRRKITNATRYLAFKKRDDFNNLFGKLLCLLKSDEWAYEREWRIVHATGPDQANRAMGMPRPSTVILGCHTRDKDRKTLMSICGALGIEVTQVRQQQEAFRFEIVKAGK